MTIESMKADPDFLNPLLEGNHEAKIAAPCIMVIFGATGDLTARRLLPALFNLYRDGALPPRFCCVGFARRDKDNEIFRDEMKSAIQRFSRVKTVEDEQWKTFSERLFYHRSDFDKEEGYESLNKFLKKLDAQYGTLGNRVYYLSTQPKDFTTIIDKLKSHHLLYDVREEPFSRIIIEKPFGHDIQSAKVLQKDIVNSLDESQIYRIDHYLGKETVQNLLVLRFTNPIFESLWNQNHIDHVQITVAEDIGIGTRGRLFENAGILRDVVQNHVMQLLSLIAMEPPSSLQADAIRDEKVKVIQSIRPFSDEDLVKHAVRGQYGPGFVGGQDVNGYRQEEYVAPDSKIETYAALKLFIDNWRWEGVPFYIRAGKRLPKRVTEIAITFKTAPGVLYPYTKKPGSANVLVIRIQPKEGISLKSNCKVPGQESLIQPVKLEFRYDAYFGATPPEAYERLICDCMAGDNTLFARNDEVFASWDLLTPILNYWEHHTPNSHFPNYSSGQWGPPEADAMLDADHRRWRFI